MKFLVTLFDMCWVCNLSQFFVLTKKNRRNRTDVPSIRHEISKRKIRKFVCEFWFRCHFRHTKALTRRLLMTALTRLKFFLKNIQRKEETRIFIHKERIMGTFSWDLRKSSYYLKRWCGEKTFATSSEEQ